MEKAEHYLSEIFDASYDPEFYGRDHQFGRLVHARLLIQAAYFGGLPAHLRTQRHRDLMDFSFSLNHDNSLEWKFDNGFTELRDQIEKIIKIKGIGLEEYQTNSSLGATSLEELAKPYIKDLADIFTITMGQNATAWSTIKYSKDGSKKVIQSKFMQFLAEIASRTDETTGIKVSSIIPSDSIAREILKY